MLIITIIAFLIILSVLVLVHEFGHFLTARRNGVKIEEFGLGLPPRAYGKEIGGTIYSLNWLPFGGFVRLKGEDPTQEGANDPDSFGAKKISQRASILVAGVLMNFLLAVVIFYIILAFSGFRFPWPLLFEHQFRFAKQYDGVLVEELEAGAPAQKAGVEQFSLITEAAGQKIYSLDELRKITSANAGREIKLSFYTPAGEIKTISVTPRAEPEDKKGTIGVLLNPIALSVIQYQGPFGIAFSGFSQAINMVEYNTVAIGKIVGTSISRGTIKPVSENIGGPVAIAQVTGQVVQLGLLPVLEFAAVLSLTLAVINVLPIPALDGGRLLFLGIEVVTRRKINPKIEQAVNSVAFFILIALIILVSFNDIVRWVTGQTFGNVPDLFGGQK